MKRIFAFVAAPALAGLLAGCIVHSPSPYGADLGYTYDYNPPLTGMVLPAPPVVQPIVPTVASEPVVPRLPPVFSEIPEQVPRRPLPQTVTRTVIYPGNPAAFHEAAGAVPEVVPEAVPVVQAAPPPTVVYGGGPPIILGATTNTNTNITNSASVNVTNRNSVTFGQTNLSGTNIAATNFPPATNAFSVLPGTNINEAAGATTETNNLPASPPLNEPSGAPQPRLPGQPRLPDATNSGVFPQPGGTTSPSANTQQQQQQDQQQQTQQPSTATQQPQSTQPFAPVAPQ